MLPPSAERYWRSAANARGSEATDAVVHCNAGLDGDLLMHKDPL